LLFLPEFVLDEPRFSQAEIGAGVCLLARQGAN